MKLNPVADDLWELNAPMTILGMAIGHRMTVARLADGSLWLHSPVAHAASLATELQRLGRVAHIVAPNAMHDTYLEGWFAAHPQARFHGARGFSKFRPDLKFTDTLGGTADPTWAAVFAQHVVGGMPQLNEVVFLHRASRTLIVTDLVFNLGPEMPFLSRVLLKLNDCYCKFGPSRLLRSVVKDRAALRASLDEVLAWDFDAIIVSHGDNVKTGGRALLREAFAFL
ncbi:MAG: DUF4336 domain-containing protein [Opitutus sp.]|nr:DUF4336 domain-containing protein [Opitutus sp.]